MVIFTSIVDRHVRGVLFVDCVRIIRAFKEIAWGQHLLEEDLIWLSQKIEDDLWYPMESYERMALAIMDKIAGGSFSLIRRWGRDSVAVLHEKHPHMIAEDDPRETLRRFDTLSETLFDFPAVELRFIRDGEAHLEIDYGMGARAEEIATHQTVGVIERLLELAGAEKVAVEPISRSWTGDGRTVIRAKWSPGW